MSQDLNLRKENTKGSEGFGSQSFNDYQVILIMKSMRVI